MSENLAVFLLKQAYREYNEAEATATYLLMILVAGVFLFEVFWTGFRSLRSIRVFATGVFGVYPWLAWPFSPVLHRDILHFTATVAGLIIVGIPVERHWNRRWYSVFLVLTGYVTILFGAGVMWLFSDQQLAFYGTSGIIYALAAYSLTHLPRRHEDLILIEKFAVIIGVSALISVLVDPFTGPFFEPRWINGGHLSGFVIGALIGWFGWDGDRLLED